MQFTIDVYQFVALLTGFLGIIIVQYIGVRENRTTRYCNIITKQTLANNMFVRENSQIFTLLTCPDMIEEYIKKGDLYEYKKTLLRAVINMEHHFYHGLSQDRELINKIREITVHALTYYENPTPEEKNKILELGNEYYNLMTVYDYSDWLYIKAQAERKGYDTKYDKFDEIYEKQFIELQEAEPPKRWQDYFGEIKK